MQSEYLPAAIQHTFMKFTAQMTLKELRDHHPKVFILFKVDAKSRKYQKRERNPLSIALWSRSVFMQKLAYIHLNPVKTNLAPVPEAYRYSAAAYCYAVRVNGLPCLIIMVDMAAFVGVKEHQ
jgi:hypothetical protein